MVVEVSCVFVEEEGVCRSVGEYGMLYSLFLMGEVRGVYRIGVVPQMKVMPGIHQNARLLRVTGLV